MQSTTVTEIQTQKENIPSPSNQVSPLPSSFWLYVLIRKWLLLRVQEGTPIILKIQSFRNPLLDFYFHLATLLGDKLFYMTILPCLLWLEKKEHSLGDIELGRLITLLVSSGVIIGNYLKELFALPRPPSPPVWAGKKEYDYGLPSNHSIASFGVNLYLANVWLQKGVINFNFPTIFVFSVWILSICFSRMYLGVHSPADVTVGMFLGLLLHFTWISFTPSIHLFLTENPSFETLFIFSFIITSIIVTHPRSTTPSFTRTLSMLGTWIGIVLGAWCELPENQSYDFFSATFKQIFLPPSQFLSQTIKNRSIFNYLSPYTWKIILRFSIGFICANLVLFILLHSLQWFFKFLFHQLGVQKKIRSSRVAKFLSSIGIVFVISHTIPQLLKAISEIN